MKTITNFTQIPLMSSMSHDDIRKIMKNMKLINVEKESVLQIEDHPLSTFGIILKGIVGIRHLNGSGRTLKTLEAGEIFGYEPLTERRNPGYSMISETRAYVGLIPRELMERILESNQEARKFLAAREDIPKDLDASDKIYFQDSQVISDLPYIYKMLEGKHYIKCVDVASGNGRFASVLSPLVDKIHATDVSDVVIQNRDRSNWFSASNIDYRVAPAEELPFHDKSIDLVSTRLGAHHFTDFSKFLQESKRIMKDNADLVLIDLMTPESAAVGSFLDQFENMTDPSHNRILKESEVKSLLKVNGFRIKHFSSIGLFIEFEDLFQRYQLNEEERLEILKFVHQQPQSTKDQLGIKYNQGGQPSSMFNRKMVCVASAESNSEFRKD